MEQLPTPGGGSATAKPPEVVVSISDIDPALVVDDVNNESGKTVKTS